MPPTDMSTTPDPILAADEPASPARRALSLGLSLFPLMPLLPACGGGVEQQASATDPERGAQAGAPGAQPASVTGVFQHPGLLVTEPDFARIRAHIAAGEQPWTRWWD